MKRIEVEIHRTNITVSQFIASVKQVLKKKGIDYPYIPYIACITTKEFKEMPVDSLGKMNYSTETLNSDFWYTKPCHYQTCFFKKSGVGTNEICEFEFDDNKKGNGYFYFLIVTEDETAEEYTEQTAEEPEKESADEMIEDTEKEEAETDEEIKTAETTSKKIVYAVHQYINVVSPYNGEILDSQSETEYYTTYSDAQKEFNKLCQLIGDEICEWGDGSIGILIDVDFDEEPREVEFF